MFRSLLLFSVLFGLTACATKPPSDADPVPVEERVLPDKQVPQSPAADQSQEAISSAETRPKHPAVVALLDESQRSMDAGNEESAIAALERGLRLQPKSALLWQRLAQAHLQSQDWQQALILAQKSNSLAGTDILVQAANWRIIAKARRAMGDKRGAGKALRKVEELKKLSAR